MPQTPARLDAVGPLFADVLPPVRGEVSPRAYKRRYIPKTYRPEEVGEAKRIIRHWNEAFANVLGAYRANPGDACNIKAYVRMLRNVGKSEGLFQIDERVVRAAITAYRRDHYNSKLGRWMRFAAWCTCENIDARAADARVTAHRREQPRTAGQAVDEHKRVADAIVKHRCLADHCIAAAKQRVTFKAWLEAELPNPRLTEGPRREITGMIALADRRAGLSPAVREDLSKRARTVFDCHFIQPVGYRDHDSARLEAIELALIDKYPKRLAETIARLDGGET